MHGCRGRAGADETYVLDFLLRLSLLKYTSTELMFEHMANHVPHLLLSFAIQLVGFSFFLVLMLVLMIFGGSPYVGMSIFSYDHFLMFADDRVTICSDDHASGLYIFQPPRPF